MRRINIVLCCIAAAVLYCCSDSNKTASTTSPVSAKQETTAEVVAPATATSSTAKQSETKNVDGWEMSKDGKVWGKVSLPDTGWNCDNCTRFYRAAIEGRPASLKFRWASDNKARMLVNDKTAFDTFWKPSYCTDMPCCARCCDNNDNCIKNLSPWFEQDISVLSDGKNVIVWEVYQEGGGSGFYVEMKAGN